MLIAVNYHYVRPTFSAPYPGIHGVTPMTLEAQLKVLGELGTFIHGDELRAAVRGAHELPERAILVTFDDGLREQIDHALPVLRRLGVPALLFVNTGPIAHRTVSTMHQIHLLRSTVPPEEFAREIERLARARGLAFSFDGAGEIAAQHYCYDSPATARIKYLLNFGHPRQAWAALIGDYFAERFAGQEADISESLYMDVEQLRELARIGFLGTHAHEHLPLGLLPTEEAKGLLQESVRILRRWTGRQVCALSYPYGSRDATARWLDDVAAAAGIEVGFTMERAVNLDLSTPRHLARYDCADLPGAAAPTVPAARLFDDPVTPNWFWGSMAETRS